MPERIEAPFSQRQQMELLQARKARSKRAEEDIIDMTC